MADRTNRNLVLKKCVMGLLAFVVLAGAVAGGAVMGFAAAFTGSTGWGIGALLLWGAGVIASIALVVKAIKMK